MLSDEKLINIVTRCVVHIFNGHFLKCDIPVRQNILNPALQHRFHWLEQVWQGGDAQCKKTQVCLVRSTVVRCNWCRRNIHSDSYLHDETTMGLRDIAEESEH